MTAATTRDDMVDLVRAMGPAMKQRAVKYDLEASFPFENFADFVLGPPNNAVY
jgi:hypothetical protein